MPENSTFEFKQGNKSGNTQKVQNMPKSSVKCLLFVIDLCIL